MKLNTDVSFKYAHLWDTRLCHLLNTVLSADQMSAAGMHLGASLDQCLMVVIIDGFINWTKNDLLDVDKENMILTKNKILQHNALEQLP